MIVASGLYRGVTCIAIISTIAFYIPILTPDLWWCVLIYYFIVSMILSVSLAPHHGALMLSLALNAVYTNLVVEFQIFPGTRTEQMLLIWKTWSIAVMSCCLATIGVLVPMPVFAYQQLLFAEHNAIRTLRQWLRDLMEYLYHSKENEIVSRIQWAKLQKYVDDAKRSRMSITKTIHIASKFEMLHKNNLMIDPKRIQSLMGLHYIAIEMHDTVRHFKWDDVQYDLFHSIKQPLRLFVAEILDRLNDAHEQGASTYPPNYHHCHQR